MFMRVLEPCYYFSHKSADLTYTFSKWSKPWNYTILKNPDRPRSHRVLLTRFLCSVLSRRPQIANRVTPFPDSDGGLENRLVLRVLPSQLRHLLATLPHSSLKKALRPGRLRSLRPHPRLQSASVGRK